MRNKIDQDLIIALLVLACLVACGLFTLLPYRALDTGLVYGGF